MKAEIIQQFLGKFVAFGIKDGTRTLVGTLESVDNEGIVIDFKGQKQYYQNESVMYMREGYQNGGSNG